MTAFVSGDIKLDMAKLNPTAAPATPAVDPAAPVMASRAIDSSVPGCDIEVDGVFMGNTPSTVTVTPGQHTVAVKKKGYADWSRTMNIAGAGAKLTAELDKTP